LGKLGRELFELRVQRGESTNDFYVQGSMGCSLGIAMGLAMNTDKQVYALLGDGEFLMKMGSFATFMKYRPKNLRVVIFNNGCHDSTGGQPNSFQNIRDYIIPMVKVIDVERGSRDNLGRPTMTCPEIRDAFRNKVDSQL
jgi:thiamine pyrophosphate-dependent acetolactate synthase large subunit-like protein